MKTGGPTAKRNLYLEIPAIINYFLQQKIIGVDVQKIKSALQQKVYSKEMPLCAIRNAMKRDQINIDL